MEMALAPLPQPPGTPMHPFLSLVPEPRCGDQGGGGEEWPGRTRRRIWEWVLEDLPSSPQGGGGGRHRKL